MLHGREVHRIGEYVQRAMDRGTSQRTVIKGISLIPWLSRKLDTAPYELSPLLVASLEHCSETIRRSPMAVLETCEHPCYEYLLANLSVNIALHSFSKPVCERCTGLLDV